jgi:hypothetical protein
MSAATKKSTGSFGPAKITTDPKQFLRKSSNQTPTPSTNGTGSEGLLMIVYLKNSYSLKGRPSSQTRSTKEKRKTGDGVGYFEKLRKRKRSGIKSCW